MIPRTRLTSGLVMTFTPPARAALQSPACRERHAWCMATTAEEQAVSTTTEGPPNPNAYEILPLRKACRVPTATPDIQHES